MAEREVNEWLTSENIDPKRITKVKLQTYLRGRNLPTSGNKQQLEARVRGVYNMGCVAEFVQKTEDRRRDLDRESQRLLTPLGENLPDPVTLTDWVSDCSSFPKFSDKEMYNYLVLSKKTFDHESTSAKKELNKAQLFYKEGHVQNIRYHGVSDDSTHCFIRCQCLPSFPGTSARKKPAYTTWICMSKISSHVHSAYCGCVAGLCMSECKDLFNNDELWHHFQTGFHATTVISHRLGESCSHIAALMVALVDMTKLHLDGKLAPTSRACSWIKPRERTISPKKSTEIAFSGKSNKVKSDFTKTPVTVKTAEELERFRSKLSLVNANAAWLKNFVSAGDVQVTEQVPDLPKLHSVDRMYHDGVDLKSAQCVNFFKAYAEQLHVSSQDCVKIFDVTRGQSSNDLWFESRYGRLTASTFGSIYHRKPTTPPDNLLKLLLRYRVPYQEKAVHHGIQYEPVARDSYLLVMKDYHPPLKVQDSGLCINSKFPFLGAIPDGLCQCDHCKFTKGLVEIKCPWKFRNVTPKQAALSDNFYCNLCKDGSLKLKRTHSYYYQVQGQMGITGRRWCDFVVWTFKGVSVERINFNEKLWDDILLKLKAFFENAMLPELFSERVKRGRVLFPKS